MSSAQPQNPSQHYDALETRDPADREAALMAALPGQVARAQKAAPAFAEILAGVHAAGVDSRAALARLPVTRKHSLFERQRASVAAAADPFGGFSAIVRGAAGTPRLGRVYASPGPIYEPEAAHTPDYWHCARALFAAGLRPGDLVHNAFSYHMTPGAYIMESGAFALGCAVFPAGTGQTEQQLQAIAELQPQAYTGTPSFLRILVEKAAEAGQRLSITKGMVGGEAFPPSLRDWFSERGLAIYQSYATADLGVVAYETAAREGLIVDEAVILEIVRPGTGDPVPEGEVGEVVVTVLNPHYPLIRFGTGDLSAILPGVCPTGRTNQRIKGWLGRADQTTKIRGMFVHPSQVAEIVRRFGGVSRARLVVAGEMANDTMTLKVEAPDDAGLRQKIADAIREVTKLRGDVEFVAPGSLPNDGKVIEDARSYK